jgi:hypothetical protein
MPGGEEWLLSPVLAGHYRMSDLKDGTLDLADIALLYNALAVKHENERRYQMALDKRAKP